MATFVHGAEGEGQAPTQKHQPQKLQAPGQARLQTVQRQGRQGPQGTTHQQHKPMQQQLPPARSIAPLVEPLQHRRRQQGCRRGSLAGGPGS